MEISERKLLKAGHNRSHFIYWARTIIGIKAYLSRVILKAAGCALKFMTSILSAIHRCILNVHSTAQLGFVPPEGCIGDGTTAAGYDPTSFCRKILS